MTNTKNGVNCDKKSEQLATLSCQNSRVHLYKGFVSFCLFFFLKPQSSLLSLVRSCKFYYLLERIHLQNTKYPHHQLEVIFQKTVSSSLKEKTVTAKFLGH